MSFRPEIKIALILCALLGGCVTAGSPTTRVNGDVVVVERSKEHPPSWTGSPTGRISDSEGVYRFVEINGRLLNLPLGLKQTQLSALAGCRKALTESVREHVSDGLKSDGVAIGNQSEFDSQLNAAVDEVHGKYAKVADIYFEKLVNRDAASGDPAAEFYAAYVLVNFPKDRAAEIYSGLGRKLSQSSDAGLRRAGQSVQALARSADLTH